MSTSPLRFADLVSGLGDIEELQEEGRRFNASGAVPLTNSHIHLPPNFSAFDTELQAVDLAAHEGLWLLGASNYYDYTVYSDFTAHAAARGIFPLFGLEVIALDRDLLEAGILVNDPGNAGKIYICGKGISRFDPLSERAQPLLQAIRDRDSARMEEMAIRLSAVFAAAGFENSVDAALIVARVAARHQCAPETVYLQERHLAQAFQEILFEEVEYPEERHRILERAYSAPPAASLVDAAAVQNEMRSRLMKSGRAAFIPDTFGDFEQARALILALGGIPCYPVLADGTKPLCGFEDPVERLVEELKQRGITAAELIPIRNSPETLVRYVTALRSAGIVVTAGTEHNTLDALPLAPACKGGAELPAEVCSVFWEGACVAAAHQALVALDLPGFVDEAGCPAAGFADTEERIRTFSEIGAGVIAQFRSPIV
jgi:hypothetical protein